MKAPRFIKQSNLPPRLNLLTPVLWFLVLERFGAPGWLYGVVYTVMFVAYAAGAIVLFTGQSVDVLKDKQ